MEKFVIGTVKESLSMISPVLGLDPVAKGINVATDQVVTLLDQTGTIELENKPFKHDAFSYLDSFFGLQSMPVDVARIALRPGTANRDYKTDWKNLAQYPLILGFEREARKSINQELNMRYTGRAWNTPFFDKVTRSKVPGVPDKVKKGSISLNMEKNKFVPWHKSNMEPPKPIQITAPIEGVPDIAVSSGDLVFKNSSGYFQEKMSFKYNPHGDGDSFELTSSQNFPLSYTSYRIPGADTFEKHYSRKDYTAEQEDKHYRETGLQGFLAKELGVEASYHIYKHLQGKNITMYWPRTGWKRIGGKTNLGRMGAFAEVEIDGKKVDLGIYLASKGLAMLRKDSEFLIYDTLPSGRTKADYIRQFRKAEKYAEEHGYGMYSYGKRSDIKAENKAVQKTYFKRRRW